ncbi:aspartate aminotransferase family protein [Fredinandcohnia onubensis]|uniref:aminotransferase family protein n=1 Tax=Fredinandcohnia onubensis TaxID=1571209 RepID=UPI0031844FDA
MERNIGAISERTSELIEMDKKHYIHPTSSPKLQAEQGASIIFSEGKGVYVKNTHGDTYLDGMSMLWNVNLGHGQKELAEAAKEQMSNMAFASSFQGFSNEPAIRLAKKLASIAPGDLNSVFFTSGGSESNDTAIKLSRFYWILKGQPRKRKIIAIENGYHGVTVAAQTATFIPHFHNFSGSNIEEVYHAKPYLTNCELGDKSDPNFKGSIRDIVEREGADTIAAIIIEPVQGSGGVNIPPEGYMQAVRKLCDEFGILFIADEVICGFGRTGKMFGVENWNVVPDLMSIAKGITSGYSQLGGVLLNDKIRNTISQYDGVLAHGFTYSGHPTACAVGLKNLEILERDEIVENVKNMEEELEKGLKYLSDNHWSVTKTRVIGLLAAFELWEDRNTGKNFDVSIQPGNVVANECFNRKLILRGGLGSHRQTVVMAPPLIINREEVQKLINIIDASITAFEKSIK